MIRSGCAVLDDQSSRRPYLCRVLGRLMPNSNAQRKSISPAYERNFSFQFYFENVRR